MMENGLTIKKMEKDVILTLLPMKSMMAGGWMAKNMDLELMFMLLEISTLENGRTAKSTVKGRLNTKMVVNWNANLKRTKLMVWVL